MKNRTGTKDCHAHLSGQWEGRVGKLCWLGPRGEGCICPSCLGICLLSVSNSMRTGTHESEFLDYLGVQNQLCIFKFLICHKVIEPQKAVGMNYSENATENKDMQDKRNHPVLKKETGRAKRCQKSL